MKLYFDQNIVAEAEEHAKEVFPQESCGFILDDEYLPMDNIAKDKVGHFKIDPKQFIIHNESIRAIVHSHGNYPHASKMAFFHPPYIIYQVAGGVSSYAHPV